MLFDLYLYHFQTKQNKQISHKSVNFTSSKKSFLIFNVIQLLLIMIRQSWGSWTHGKGLRPQLLGKTWENVNPKMSNNRKTSHFLYATHRLGLIQQTGVSISGNIAKIPKPKCFRHFGGHSLTITTIRGNSLSGLVARICTELEDKKNSAFGDGFYCYVLLFLKSCSLCCFLIDYPTKNQFDLTFSLSFAGTRTNYSCTRWHGITYFLRNSTAETLLPNAMSKSVISCCQVLKCVSESKSNSVSWCASLRIYLKHAEVGSLCYQSCWLCWQSVGTSH